jgi:hypothetical protein
MKKLGLSWLIAAFPMLVWSQIPTELFVSKNSATVESFWFKDLDSAARFNVFNFTRLSQSFRDDIPSDVFNQTLLTYNFTQTWGLSAGANYAAGKFVPTAALSFTQMSADGSFYLNLFPTVELRRRPNAEMFGIAIWTPRLNQHLKLFTQIIAGSNFNLADGNHQFSYQQLRLGLDVKEWFQAGIGVNFNQFGSHWTGSSDIGFFLRRAF